MFQDLSEFATVVGFAVGCYILNTKIKPLFEGKGNISTTARILTTKLPTHLLFWGCVFRFFWAGFAYLLNSVGF